MRDDFDMSDVLKRIADIESGKHGAEYHHVFDLVHAVHHKLHRIASLTTANVNQNLSSRRPESTVTCEATAIPDEHPHLDIQNAKGHDLETISRYIKLGFIEFDAGGISVNVKANVRVADHPKLDEDPKIVWVKFNINKYIMVRSVGGKEYKWKLLSWKPQKVDLMNGRNTLAPGAERGGEMIVKPTFYIRPGDMQKIQTDTRKRIPEAIHNGVNELIDRQWEETGVGSASS